MNCSVFLHMVEEWKGEVCLFGAGDYGRTWGYDIVIEAGFSVSCYIDNYCKFTECNGLPVLGTDYLHEHKDALVVVTVMGEAGRAILEQLREMDVDNVLWLHEGEIDPRVELAQCLYECADKRLKDRFVSLMDDEIYLQKRFKMRMGYLPDLKKPRTFNEKLNWLKLHDRNPAYTKMVDKYAVKELIAKKIGEEYVIPTLGVWEKFEDIDFDGLPFQFVLKCTHDSGSVMICRDKRSFSKETAKNRFEKCLKQNSFWPDREWPYMDVPRRIMAEQLIGNSVGMIVVYKVFNFMGTPKLIQVIQDDKTETESIDYYDTDWNLLDIRQNYPNSKQHIQKPDNLEELLSLASILSAGTSFVRTDFYIVEGRIYFSEFTFYSDSGAERFHPEDWDRKLGDLIFIG